MQLTVLGCQGGSAPAHKMPSCDIWVYHIKPAFYDETVDELARLDGRVRVLSDGEVHVL